MRIRVRPGLAAAEIIGTIVLVALVILFVRLGFWQLHRLDQRRATNALIDARQHAAPIMDPARLEDSASAAYRRVTVSGRYDAARSIVLPGRSFDGAPGVHLLTPLVLDSDRAVLVNRGWVPARDAATIEVDSFPPVAQPATGIVLPFPRPADSRGGTPAAGIPSPQGFRRVWYTIDPTALRAQFPYRLLPVTLQLLPSPDAPAYPKRLGPPSLDEGPHFSYAIQWFSFALIGVVGWLALLRRSRQSRGQGRTAPPLPGAQE